MRQHPRYCCLRSDSYKRAPCWCRSTPQPTTCSDPKIGLPPSKRVTATPLPHGSYRRLAVSTGELLREAQLQAGLAEQPRSERYAVVHEHALHGNAPVLEVAHGSTQERGGAMTAFVRIDLGEGYATTSPRGEPKIRFASMRSVANVLGDSNRALLKIIRETTPRSELASSTGQARRRPGLPRRRRSAGNRGRHEVTITGCWALRLRSIGIRPGGGAVDAKPLPAQASRAITTHLRTPRTRLSR